MAAYRLEGPLAEAFEALRKRFTAAPGHEIRLSPRGSTALASRWSRRQTGDLDLPVDPGDDRRAHTRGRELQVELQARRVRDPTVCPHPRLSSQVGGLAAVTFSRK